MAGWRKHQGRAVALPLANVDTDQLIPARFMSVPRAEGYGDYLLHDLRRTDGGDLRDDLALNRHPGASALIAARNFGCGSSREAAVYALVDAGFRVVVAPSFGDIFAANAINNGLLPARVAEAGDILDMLGAGAADFTVDLETRRIGIGGQVFTFELDEMRAKKLMNGWDDIDLTIDRQAQIEAFRDAYFAAVPWARLDRRVEK